MNRRYIFIGILLMVFIVIGGIWLWNWVLGDTEAASGPITAIPVVTDTSTAVTQPTQIETEAPIESTDVPVDEEVPVESLPLAFQISQEESQTSFMIHEDFRSSPLGWPGGPAISTISRRRLAHNAG